MSLKQECRQSLSISTKVGKAGQKIAEMGSFNGVPQVRFEVRLRGKAVNPAEYLPARR